jgi:hypothetical protein
MGPLGPFIFKPNVLASRKVYIQDRRNHSHMGSVGLFTQRLVGPFNNWPNLAWLLLVKVARQ